MATFWTSDQHFGHARIIELSGRPFRDVDHMDTVIRARWMETVDHDDTVMVLGDVAMGSFADSVRLFASLPGRKILVPGNHDRVSSCYKGSPAKKEEWRAMYHDVGFAIADEICGTDIGGVPVIVSHFPYVGDSHGDGADRYADKRPDDDGLWLLHGHVHEEWKVRNRMINVGVDVWNFTPVSERQLLEIITPRACTNPAN